MGTCYCVGCRWGVRRSMSFMPVRVSHNLLVWKPPTFCCQSPKTVSNLNLSKSLLHLSWPYVSTSSFYSSSLFDSSHYLSCPLLPTAFISPTSITHVCWVYVSFWGILAVDHLYLLHWNVKKNIYIYQCSANTAVLRHHLLLFTWTFILFLSLELCSGHDKPDLSRPEQSWPQQGPRATTLNYDDKTPDRYESKYKASITSINSKAAVNGFLSFVLIKWILLIY